MDEKTLAQASIPSDEEVALALALRESLEGGEGLADFIRRVSPHRPPPPHLLALIDKIEEARTRAIRLCISMPPRHAKTVTILHAIAWWLQRFPSDMNAYASYSDAIALSKSRICRGIASRAGCPLGGMSDAAGEWTTTLDGGVVAMGAGAGLTGRGIQGLMVVDDPYKNREEADSTVIREKVWEWFTEVCLTRLEGASVIVCHTRWHEDDLIGRLVRQGWDYINFAAIAEEGDDLGRQPGEALWPDNPNFTAAEIEKIRADIGPWSFAALYQGQPRPRGNAIFGPESYHDDDSVSGCRIVIYADPAASKKTTADYGVMMAMAVSGYRENQRGKIIDLYRGQHTIPEFTRRLRAFQIKHHEVPVFVESVGAFKVVPQLLKEIDPTLRVREDYPQGDKFQRAQRPASAWNEGRITVPLGAPWLKAFLEEIQKFTGINDAHDDQVDCLSGCWKVGSTPPPSYAARSPGAMHTTRR